MVQLFAGKVKLLILIAVSPLFKKFVPALRQLPATVCAPAAAMPTRLSVNDAPVRQPGSEAAELGL